MTRFRRNIPLEIAARLRRWVFAAAGVRTRGVRVLATDARRRVLLVRHRYGSRQLMLPGGGAKRGETPAAAARRELCEETGCSAQNLVAAGVFDSRAEGWRDTVHLFHADVAADGAADGFEIGETLFVDPDDLPVDVSAATRRRIDEWRGRRAATKEW